MKKSSKKKTVARTVGRTFPPNLPGPMMSENVKKMTTKILVQGEDAPLPAQKIAMILSHFAWNESIGYAPGNKLLSVLKKEIAKGRRKMPNLWDEFVDSDLRVLMDKLIQYKLKTYPHDERLIMGIQLASDDRYKEGGRIRVAFVPKEMRDEFQKIPEARQQALLLELLNREG
jgi:hypothetical protein